MEFEEKQTILKHIQLGTSEVLYFPYNNGTEPLPVRPISSYELDQCYYKALDEAPTKIADFVIKVKMGLIKKNQNINVSNDGYKNLKKFYDTIDYWIVYYGMKDFQDDEFSKPSKKDYNLPKGMMKIRQMENVHDIAKFILDSSHKPEEIIKQVYKTQKGEEVAMKIVYMKEPLANLGDLTKLQEEYILYSKGKVQQTVRSKKKLHSIVRSDKSYKLKDLMRLM